MGVYLDVLWGMQYVRLVVLGSIALATLLALCGPQRTRARRAVWAGVVLSLGVILAVTTFPAGVGYASPRCLLGLEPSVIARAVVSAEGFLNFALFVPLGLTLAIATRRLAPAITVAFCLALLVEGYQAFTPAHSCTGTDALLNILGAVVGAVVGAWHGRPRQRPH